MMVGTSPGAHSREPLALPTLRLLGFTAGKLFCAIEGARRGEAVLGDTALPGKPLRTIGATRSAGYIRFRTASRQSAAVSRRRSAELRGSAFYLGLAYKRIQLRSESRGEVRATNRAGFGFVCNAEYDRCGGAECHDDQARNTHRILRSQFKSEIIPYDLARNDNSGDDCSISSAAWRSFVARMERSAIRVCFGNQEIIELRDGGPRISLRSIRATDYGPRMRMPTPPTPAPLSRRRCPETPSPPARAR